MLVNPSDAAHHRVSVRDIPVMDLLGRPAILHSLTNEVGDTERASHLMESIFFQVPIAQLTLRYLRSGDTTVLDGVWRLSVLKSFVDGGFPLAGMDYFPQLSGKTFSELPGMLQRRILEACIRCVILDIGMTDEMCVRYLQQIRS